MSLVSRRPVRIALAGMGALILGGISTAAMADEEVGADDIEIDVEITEIDEPGILAMTVAGSSISLTEDGSNEAVRQFIGELPTVTVTDTRSSEEIPEGVYWSVLGSTTDFVTEDGESTISAANLGWVPELIDGGEQGLVSEGDEVDSAVDGGPGLVDQELLTMAYDSAAIAEEGQWTATADLVLRTEPTVDPGDYTSTLTLSLFE